MQNAFANTCKFSNHYTNQVYFVAVKKYLPIWIHRWLEKLQWDMITREGRFLLSLRLEDITDADSTYTKRVWKDFEIKNLGEYYGFYVQSDALLLVHVENKISSITDIDMLLMIEKVIKVVSRWF